MAATAGPAPAQTRVVLRAGTWVDGVRLAEDLGPGYAVADGSGVDGSDVDGDVVVLAAEAVRGERTEHPEASLVALLPAGAPIDALVTAYEDGADAVLSEASGRELAARVRAAARRRSISRRTPR